MSPKALLICLSYDQVECRTRLGSEWSGPSERLARMMEKQDGKLVQRLKGYVESTNHSVYVC